MKIYENQLLRWLYFEVWKSYIPVAWRFSRKIEDIAQPWPFLFLPNCYSQNKVRDFERERVWVTNIGTKLASKWWSFNLGWMEKIKMPPLKNWKSGTVIEQFATQTGSIPIHLFDDFLREKFEIKLVVYSSG